MGSKGMAMAGVPPTIQAVGIRNNTFPKLKIEIVENGEVVRTIEFDDPRERYIRTWSELQNYQPVSLAT